MILVDHDPQWKAVFQELAEIYRNTLGDLALSIEHVGSTAIAGIVAKPILDIDIVIASDSHFPAVQARLETLGYWHNGDQGIPGREVFKCTDETVPRAGNERSWMLHHLYVCVAGGRELLRHTAFRDYLNQHEPSRKEYERIKRAIAAKSDGDRKVYARIKEHECREFVESVLLAANAQQNEDISHEFYE